MAKKNKEDSEISEDGKLLNKVAKLSGLKKLITPRKEKVIKRIVDKMLQDETNSKTKKPKLGR